MSLKEDIDFSLELLDKHCSKLSLLAEYTSQTEPDEVYLAGIASMIHSYYNGVENVFKLINKASDNASFEGNKSHLLLLEFMAEKTEKRSAVISAETRESLREFMAFRHFFRHAYSFNLQWNKIKPLLHSVSENWKNLRSEFMTFEETL